MLLPRSAQAPLTLPPLPPTTKRHPTTASLSSHSTAPSARSIMQRQAPLRALVRENPCLPSGFRLSARRAFHVRGVRGAQARGSTGCVGPMLSLVVAASASLLPSFLRRFPPPPKPLFPKFQRLARAATSSASSSAQQQQAGYATGVAGMDKVRRAGSIGRAFASLSDPIHPRGGLSPLNFAHKRRNNHPSSLPTRRVPTNPLRAPGPHVALRGERVHQRPLRRHGGAPRGEFLFRRAFLFLASPARPPARSPATENSLPPLALTPPFLSLPSNPLPSPISNDRSSASASTSP